MATDAGEIDRKRGPGASGPSVLHDPPLTRHSSAAEVVLSYLRDQVVAIARYDPLAVGPIIDREATRPLGEELKWLAVTLGQARDAEVMLDRLKASLAGIPPPWSPGRSRPASPPTSPPSSHRRGRPRWRRWTGGAIDGSGMTWTGC
jgi:hypothetical protein